MLVIELYVSNKDVIMPVELQWQQVSQQLRRQSLPKLLTILFALLLCIAVIQLVVNIWPRSAAVTTDPLLQAQVKPLPDIPSWHLFGDYGIIKAGMLPITQLDLKLEGVFYASEAAESMVLVSTPSVSVKPYHVGDSLPGGAKIKEILPNGVIIDYNNQLQNLPLKKPKLDFLPKPKGLEALGN